MSHNVVIDRSRGLELKKALLDRLRWLVYVVILGSLSSGVLMGVSYLIPLASEEGLNLEARLLILKSLDIEHTTENVEHVFADSITIEEIEALTIYQSGDGSVAFKVTGRGHMAPITALIALGPDLKTMKGLVILEQQETPGLGGRITEGDFLDQFRSVAVEPELVILPAGREPAKENEVEGITGATMTSRALEDMVNQAIREIVQILEGR